MGQGLSDISINYSTGLGQAIQHLKELRHQKIGYIGGSSGLTISDHRIQAFVKAMDRAGLKADPKFLLVGNYRISGGEAAMAEVLTRKDRPTALIAANDLTAIGALRALHRAGLSAPRDYSIIGFDDIELCDVLDPPLTTIRLPRQEMAEKFATALESSAKEPHAPGKIYTIKTSLVVRTSTGPVRKRK